MYEYALVPDEKKVDFARHRHLDLNTGLFYLYIFFAYYFFYGVLFCPEIEQKLMSILSSFVVFFFVYIQHRINYEVMDTTIKVFCNIPIEINSLTLEKSCEKLNINTFEQLNQYNSV